MLRCRPLACLLALLLTSPSFLPAQGIFWESTSTGGGELASEGVAKNYAVPRKFKREDAQRTIIVRLDKEAMYMVDVNKKTYMEMTFADMEKMTKQASDQLAEMNKLLKDMPPEQRALVEKQFAKNPLLKGVGDKEVNIEVEKSADSRDILGRACQKHVAKENGTEVLSAWVTNDVKEFTAIRKDWVEVMRRMATANPMIGKNRAAAFEKIEGFPMETEMNGVKTTVTRVEPRALAESDFEIPAGFTMTAMPAIPGGFGGPGGLGPKNRGPKDKVKAKGVDGDKSKESSPH